MSNINNSMLKAGIDKLANAIESFSGTSAPTSSFFNMSEPKLITFPPVSVEGLPAVTSGTHPSVIYHPYGFNGYKYWMAYTPYPGVRNENPCIVASNDGFNFVTPSGLTNPVAPPPAEPNYNSDTELVMVAVNKMRLYWREYVPGGQSRLLFKESSNGVVWGETQECILSVYVDPVSPCIIKLNNGTYKMWLGHGANGGALELFESSDGKNWNNKQTCISNIDGNGFVWHPMVWMTFGRYHCIAAAKDGNKTEAALLNTDLYYGQSGDGINWTFEENPVFSRGQFGIKEFRVYRSCAVRSNGRYKIYISGLGKESEQIHVVEADKLGTLAE